MAEIFPSVVVAWNRLTQYGVRCIKQLIADYPGKIAVVSNEITQPVKNLEENLGHKIIWVKSRSTDCMIDVVGFMPDVYFSGGWGTPVLWQWTKEAKRAGAVVVAMPDEAYIGFSFRELAKNLRFRLFLKKWHDYYFVCGKSGRRLFRSYGVRDDKIIEGLYAGDPIVFHDGIRLSQRPKRFIFVGQLVDRKNVRRMCEAFRIAGERHPGWVLDIYGVGKLKDELPNDDVIHVNGYVQTAELGDLYRDARCFVLGSVKENWGVVVHEAAECGCWLMLSKQIGSGPDFATSENASTFDAYSTKEFANAFEKVMMLSDDALDRGQQVSVREARKFSPAVFSLRAQAIIRLGTSK